MQTFDELVAQSAVFSGLDEAQIDLIAGCGHIAVFDAGGRLFREGDPADTFFLIRRGRVAIETAVPARGAMTLETLGDGELVGWSWLVPPYRSAFGARAVDVAHVIAFDGACLRDKCESDPALGYDLLKVVATTFVRRLEDTRMRLLDLYAGVPGGG